MKKYNPRPLSPRIITTLKKIKPTFNPYSFSILGPFFSQNKKINPIPCPLNKLKKNLCPFRLSRSEKNTQKILRINKVIKK
jgi:hypothetical protein